MFPAARIEMTGRSRPVTETAGRQDPDAEPGSRGGHGDRDGSMMTGPGRPGGMTTADVIDLITDDHARIRRLLAALDEFAPDGSPMPGQPAPGRPAPGRPAPGRPAPGGDDRTLEGIWAALSWLLKAHIDAEEEICRLVMAAAGEHDDRLESSFADHWDIQEAVAEARLCETGSRRWWRAVADARSASTRHFRAEEDHVLATFRQQTDREAREVLGRQWTAFMRDRRRDDAAGNDRENARGRST
jgi:hypothetical protein